MVIVSVLGGLGNQMFQYALYLRLCEIYECVKLDISRFEKYKLHNGYELERVFGVTPDYAKYSDVKHMSLSRKNPYITRIYKYVFKKRKYEYLEKETHIYDENVFKQSDHVYYCGYWQNEKYFINIREKLLNEYKFKHVLSVKNVNLKLMIEDSDSVSVHVRRGDYMKQKRLQGICDLVYYKNAFEEIEKRIINPKYFIFSDDIKWCAEQFKEKKCVFVDWNNNDLSYLDMQMMSICKHNIIANSSFSWWAAWLNKNMNKIVVAPAMWVVGLKNTDIIPMSWVKI